MKKPLVYIIILNWNGYKETIDCLESLKKINYSNYKIVIVDNGSTDDSVNIIEKKHPEIHLIINKKNLGYCEGNNIGMNYAFKYKPDYILLLNNDVVVSPNFLEELVNVSECDKKIGLVGPKIYFESMPDILWFAGGKMDYSTGKAEHIGYLEKDKKQYDDILDTEYVTGCSVLIRTSIIKKLGGLDNSYFIYYEDIDLDFRLKKAGYKTLYAPKSMIWHKVSSASGGEENAFKDYYMSRNPFFFARKNIQNNRSKFITYMFFDRFQKILILLVKGNFRRVIAILRGIRDGFIMKFY
jgi:GT2 family glycosyltransferase